MTYTTDQLSSMMDALTLRVTALDGQGMKDPTQCQVAAIIKAINGVQSDLNQLTLQLESLLKQLQSSVDTNTTVVRQTFNLT